MVIPAGFCQEYPFESDIRKFIESDRVDPPPKGAILFAGSSSFTMWTDVQEYFPGRTILNRGFGGSTLLDQIRYADQIILPYKPKQIVIYCGENDLASSDTVTSDKVIERFETLFHMIRSELPDVTITYVSMKPSPSRWHLAEKMRAGNEGIRDFLRLQNNTSFVDVWEKMLDHHQYPDGSLFLDDSLHMNSNGYKIWQSLIGPELIR